MSKTDIKYVFDSDIRKNLKGLSGIRYDIQPTDKKTSKGKPIVQYKIYRESKLLIDYEAIQSESQYGTCYTLMVPAEKKILTKEEEEERLTKMKSLF